MLTIKKLLALGAMLALAACATTPVESAPEPQPVQASPAETARAGDLTILVSIDGFRADYLDRGVTPVMSKLAENGARGAMEPSFPSKTFPNHYALITGRTPDHNGMINNTMEDPAKPGFIFMLANRAVTSDPFWWEEAVPLWVSAEKQGVKTATMFWPGSDYELFGERPSEFLPFDQKLPDFARVDILLSWLDKPAAERPRFATLYFDIVDTAGHIYGPNDPRTTSATAQVDAAIGRLKKGLKARGLWDGTNIVITADHGMAEVSDDQIMRIDEWVAPEKMHVVWTGAFAGLSPKPGFEAEVETALLGRKAHGTCWRKQDLPERFDYGTNDRVPAIVCLGDVGWRYETETMKAYRNSGGDHGFDPADPLMRAIFIAHGPSIRKGVELETFRNVSVYPLLARLSGVAPEENDGDIADVDAALK